MNALLNSKFSLFIIVIAFLLFAMINSVLFQGFRIDFTENKLFTLSEGSKEIIKSVGEPIHLSLYFSKKQSQEYPSLTNYAKRVEELLSEYEGLGKGNISVRLIDPEPFSVEEDEAAELGLQSVPIGQSGDNIYFGLVAQLESELSKKSEDTNYKAAKVIPFFQMNKETFLEYDISKLIYQASHNALPKLALYSELPMTAGFDPMTQQGTPAWMIYEQIAQTFEVTELEPDFKEISDNVNVLMVVHPKSLSEESAYAIDQFVLKGGHALIFVDPYAEADISAGGMMAGMMPPAKEASDLPNLFKSWGLRYDSSQVLTDAEYALPIAGPMGQRIRHFALLGFDQKAFDDSDIVTMQLEKLNLGFGGSLSQADDSLSTVQYLIQTSVNSSTTDAAQLAMMPDPRMLQRGFQPSGEVKGVAVRVSGKASSAFNQSEFLKMHPELLEQHQLETDQLNVIVVADTDLLTDRYWVRVQNFFGQRVASPWADNASFVANALENLSGSSALISIRSRGQFSRPFTLLQSIQADAEKVFLEKQESLQQKLQATEQKLTELQNARQGEEGAALVLSEDQQIELKRFQGEKLGIRKQLREVQHQLNADIENLGALLKLLNIILVPVLLSLISIVLWKIKQTKPRAM